MVTVRTLASTFIALFISTSVMAKSPKASFASLLVDEKTNQALSARLGPVCTPFLASLYKSGKNLKSEILVSALQPLKNAPTNSEGSHFDFFHYTPYDDVPNLLHTEISDRDQAQKINEAAGTYDEILTFLRTRNKALFDMTLYVSSETETAKNHGPRLVSFTFAPQTQVLDQDKVDFQKVFKELESRIPDLEIACDLGVIYPIVADDSGVDLIDFHGISTPHTWFQIVSFKNVTLTHILK